MGTLGPSSGTCRRSCAVLAASRLLLTALHSSTCSWFNVAIHMDGMQMATKATKVIRDAVEARAKIGETEKLTINLGVVDLGQIDLLVQEGFYSNRTDLIRTAIRNQLAVHTDEIKRTLARRTLVLGLQHFSRKDLERARAAGEMLQIHVVGLAQIADDVTPDLALATI